MDGHTRSEIRIYVCPMPDPGLEHAVFKVPGTTHKIPDE